MKKLLPFLIIVTLFITSCGEDTTFTPILPTKSMFVQSPAFKNEEEIPVKYTCYGQGLNPPLEIRDIPNGTKSLAIILDDSDATLGIWNHWLMWNITPSKNTWAEGEKFSFPQGTTSNVQVGYQAPCPSSSTGTHRYIFKVYALDTILTLPHASRKEDLLAAMQNHILDRGTLLGTYRKIQ